MPLQRPYTEALHPSGYIAVRASLFGQDKSYFQIDPVFRNFTVFDNDLLPLDPRTSTFFSVLTARTMPDSMASSKLLVELEIISVTRATDITLSLFDSRLGVRARVHLTADNFPKCSTRRQYTVTLFLVWSPFIFSLTALIALSSSASVLVSPSFFFRKLSRTRATSSLSANETSEESLFCRAIPQYRTMPQIAFSSAFATYFLTSTAQSSAIVCSCQNNR